VAWYTSANINGIEVAPGSLGMVTGTQGRGIHAVFPTQTLANVGDSLVASYTFRTPATVGTTGTAAFRVGLFDTLGRAGLAANITSSSSVFAPEYGYFGAPTTGLPGYMMDMDTGAGSATADLNFRQHDTPITATTPTGRLMGTTTGFTNISPSGPDGAYLIVANTTYSGSITITRSSATDLQLTGALGSATHTVTDAFDSASFGMIAFWANSGIFGSSATPNTVDNGIDFSNIKIEYIAAIPEPGAFMFGGLMSMLVGVGAARRGLLARRK
jgi:hypothetical protein